MDQLRDNVIGFGELRARFNFRSSRCVHVVAAAAENMHCYIIIYLRSTWDAKSIL